MYLLRIHRNPPEPEFELALGSPVSYRGHRAAGTVAVHNSLFLLVYCVLRCNYIYISVQ